MFGFTRGSVWIALPCAIALGAVAACHKAPATTTIVTPAPVQVVSKPKPVVAKKPVVKRVLRKADDSSATLLRYLPRDSAVVLGINWTKARESSFVRSFDPMIEKAFPGIGTAQSSCGFDALTVVHSVAIALGDDPTNDDKTVIAVSGDFDRQSIEACIVTHGGKVEGNRYDSETNSYWPSEHIVVIAKGFSSEELSLTPSASAWDNDKLMQLVDSVDLHAVLWIAGTVPPSAASTFSQMGGTPWGGHATVDMLDGMRFSLGFEFDDASQADGMKTMLEMGLSMGKSQAQFKELIEAITLERIDLAVLASGFFSEAQLKELQSLLAGIF